MGPRGAGAESQASRPRFERQSRYPCLICMCRKEASAAGDRENELETTKPSQDTSNEATELTVGPLSLPRPFSAGSTLWYVMYSPFFPLLVLFQGSSQTHPFQEVFSDHPSQHDSRMPQRKQPWVLGLAQAHAHCKTRPP